MARPTNAAKAATKTEGADALRQYEKLGDGWPFLISFLRWYPDMLLDLFRAEDADYELTLIQRIFLRLKARYQYCGIMACRGATKSFCSITEEMIEMVLWPGITTAYYGPSFTQTAKIANQIYKEIEKNYPGLAWHFTVVSNTKDSFELGTPYGSRLSIQAYRGATCHKAVAEEYAQENPPPFDAEKYNQVVVPVVRAQYMVNGTVDPTYIPFKLHYITSSGRRQNHSYEDRRRYFEAMQRGAKNSYVIDVPYDVILLLGMRPVQWAENMRSRLTPDEWAREMESRCTGADQNPVIRDQTLTDARILLCMEEHHCCYDQDNRLEPHEVKYVFGYDVSYAVGDQNAKCALAVLKLTEQKAALKRDRYMKQLVYLDDWAPMDEIGQAKKLKQLWRRFSYAGSETLIAIDNWQYGTAVTQALMRELDDELPPLCIMDHAAFTELENPGCVPVIYPIRAGGPGCTDPDTEMLRYAEVQFENQNVQILTPDYNAGIDAYKKLHRLKDDRSDSFIFRPYQKTQELIGQIQNLKKVVSGAGFSERRISNKIQRDSWSALKYALRLAQRLEERYLAKAARESQWDKYYEAGHKKAVSAYEKGSAILAMRGGVGRTGGRRV
jgi:hypothetical protein